MSDAKEQPAAAAPAAVAPKTAKAKAAARPLATVYSVNGRATKRYIAVPDALLAPIRQDVVNFVHTQMAKNNRQAYGVRVHWGPKGIVAGHGVAAASWGTGRAVARIPRVKGGGTHRAGQGAFGNMCRGGRMFAPTKVWRRWHRKINTNQKRYAVVSAVAASAVPALVMAKGHRIQAVDEIPLVVEDDFELINKTKQAVNALQSLHLGSELRRCKRRYKRAGRGKARNRRWRHRTGPLIIYKNDRGIVAAARNIRGVDLCQVAQLNLLKLAPGGHVGRLLIWTESAMRDMTRFYGTVTKGSRAKRNYHLPRPLMMNSDLQRIINSQEIQSSVRPTRKVAPVVRKRNPLKHPQLYAELNPLFEQRWNELKKTSPDTADARTTKLLKPMKKKRRVTLKPTPEQKTQMQAYWKMVLGDPIYKTRPQLERERVAVQAAVLAAEREKLGLDLLDAINADEAAAAAAAEAPKDDDSEEESS